MKKIQLSNGLRVVMEQIPTSRSVSFGIWVKTGSRNESEEMNGITHFIEHMMFKGTERFDARGIAEQFDAIGGNVNAFTSKEYTCYYAKVLDEHFPIAVDVLSDMFFNSKLDETELAKEKNVILEEIAMYEDTPDDLVHDLMSLSVYGDHPLAYPILGTKERLESMDSQALKDYMGKHYTIDNTVIALAGNINDEVIELLETHFGGFSNQGSSETLAVPTFLDGVQFRKKKTEQNHICMSFPGCSIGDELTYAMALVNNAVGGGMSSRLFQEIREKRGLAYSVYSYHSSHADSGMFTIYAGTAPKQTKDVLQLTTEMLQDLAQNGMSEDELRKGKEQLKGSLILSLESTSSRMNRLGRNELMLGRHFSLDEIIQRVEQVSMKDVDAVLDRMFGTPYALAMVGTSDKALEGLGRNEFVALRSNQ